MSSNNKHGNLVPNFWDGQLKEVAISWMGKF